MLCLAFLQNLDTRQWFPFEPFEKRAARSRNIGEIAGRAGLVQRRHRVAASAFSIIRSAVAARSLSASDLPMGTPCAYRKVLAMPPPITSASTLVTRFSKRSILVETLAPPTMAITGLVGASSTLLSASS